jgi:tripartite-type tricarboxylate transporter receptor subunit TctC
VPNAPGGGFDAEARLLEPFLEARLGAEIAVDNVPGAGGIVGASAIASATPDGLTIGLLGAPGLMASALTGESEAPNPASDFSVLGRLSRSWHVWAVAAHAPASGVDEFVATSRGRPILFAITEVGSASFVTITVSAALAAARVETVPGFSGTRSAALAVVRGDVDCVSFNFDTILDLVEAGDLRPVLQLSDAPVSDHPALAGVPLLGGAEGLAARRARALGTDDASARETASALAEFVSAGRVVVAPRGIRQDVLRCLETSLADALADPALHAAARHTLDVAGSAEAGDGLRAAAERSHLLLPFIRDAIARVRA